MDKICSRKDFKALVFSVGISLGTGVLSALFTAGTMRDYADMYKPPLAPPGWLFPIVWFILYILMGTAAFLVWRTGTEGRANGCDVKNALTIYGAQLILNFLWSILFFRWRLAFIALADLLFLLFCIYAMIGKFGRCSKTAALLLVPYLVWVCFAGYLNFCIAFHL